MYKTTQKAHLPRRICIYYTKFCFAWSAANVIDLQELAVIIQARNAHLSKWFLTAGTELLANHTFLASRTWPLTVSRTWNSSVCEQLVVNDLAWLFYTNCSLSARKRISTLRYEYDSLCALQHRCMAFCSTMRSVRVDGTARIPYFFSIRCWMLDSKAVGSMSATGASFDVWGAAMISTAIL